MYDLAGEPSWIIAGFFSFSLEARCQQKRQGSVITERIKFSLSVTHPLVQRAEGPSRQPTGIRMLSRKLSVTAL
jgi:hypothetical protein